MISMTTLRKGWPALTFINGALGSFWWIVHLSACYTHSHMVLHIFTLMHLASESVSLPSPGSWSHQGVPLKGYPEEHTAPEGRVS